MPAVNIRLKSTEARGSGVVTTGNEHILTFPSQAKIASFTAEAIGGTIKVSYALDDSGPILWAEWSHGDAAAGQVWSASFQGGLHLFKIEGDGNYSFAWD